MVKAGKKGELPSIENDGKQKTDGSDVEEEGNYEEDYEESDETAVAALNEENVEKEDKQSPTENGNEGDDEVVGDEDTSEQKEGSKNESEIGDDVVNGETEDGEVLNETVDEDEIKQEPEENDSKELEEPVLEDDEPELAADEPELAADEPELEEPVVEDNEPELAVDEPELADEPELEEPVVEDNETELAVDEPELATDEPELEEPVVEDDEPELPVDEPELPVDENNQDNDEKSESGSLADPIADNEVTEQEASEKVEEEVKDNVENGLLEETILIEREGKFELVAVNDIIADQNKPKLLERRGVIGKNKLKKQSKKTHLPPLSIPSEDSRPRSTASGKKHRTTKLDFLRVQSAQVPLNSLMSNIRSAPTTFALTNEQKELARIKQQHKEDRRKLELEQERQERDRKKSEAQTAYQAWLARKQQKSKDTKGKVESAIESIGPGGDQNSIRNQEAYKEWAKMKSQKQKNGDLLKKQSTQHESTEKVSMDNQQAYYSWLRRKQHEARTLRKLSQAEFNKQAVELHRKPHRLLRQTQEAEASRVPNYYAYNKSKHL